MTDWAETKTERWKNVRKRSGWRLLTQFVVKLIREFDSKFMNTTDRDDLEK